MTAAHGNHLHKRHGLRSHGYDSVVGKGDMDTLLYYDEIRKEFHFNTSSLPALWSLHLRATQWTLYVYLGS